MSEKRFEKLAARERAARAQQQVAALQEEKAGLTGQGTILKIMAATLIALVVIVGLLVVTLTFDGDKPLRDRARDGIFGLLGLDAASKNPDILALAPAPEGWRRDEFTGIRDGRIARGVVELAMLRIAEDPASRETIIADLVERIRDGGLDSLSDAEQEVLGGTEAVAAGRMLRQFGGDIAVAAYTDGINVFTMQIMRADDRDRADAFSLIQVDKARVRVAGLEFDDGAQNAGGGQNPLHGVQGMTSLSRQLADDAFLYIHGIGSEAAVETLIGASDLGLISGGQDEAAAD